MICKGFGTDLTHSDTVTISFDGECEAVPWVKKQVPEVSLEIAAAGTAATGVGYSNFVESAFATDEVFCVSDDVVDDVVDDVTDDVAASLEFADDTVSLDVILLCVCLTPPMLFQHR